MLNQTLNYLDHFSRFTQKENVEAVERLLSAHKDLAKFERAQLGMETHVFNGQTLEACLKWCILTRDRGTHRLFVLRKRRRSQDAHSVLGG